MSATNESRCTHWNTCLPDGTPLKAIRCSGEDGHDGRHYCGSTAWGEALGFRLRMPGNQPGGAR